MATDIYLDNAYVIEDRVQRTNRATGEPEAPVELAMTGWLAAEPEGAAIHADLSVQLPYRYTDDEGYAVFSGSLDETALAEHLGPLLTDAEAPGGPGRLSVYEVCRSADGDYRTHKRRTVRASRPAR